MRRSASVLFLGTGNAFNTDGRGSQCLWFEPRRGDPFLVDLGPTAMESVEKAGAKPERLGAVFFTHLHGDHTAGWPFFLLRAKFLDRRLRTLTVFGPRGTRKRLADLASACYEDLLVPGRLPFSIEHVELPVRRAARLQARTRPSSRAGFAYDVVPVEHHPTSIGYRFHLPGVSVGVSGDTRWCPGLEELSRGCDVLLVECTSLKKQDFAHVSLEEVRALRARLAAKRVILVHLSDDVARALRRRPIPGVLAAEDGMILPIG